MKILPALILLIATAVLVALTAAAVLGFSFPYWSVALRVAGLAWGAGMLAVFVADYAPRHTGPNPVAVPAIEPSRAPMPAAQASPVDALSIEAMSTLGLGNDPATLSVS